MTEACPWCDGRCVGADLVPLVSPPLRWLWEQIGAAADRRGDTHLTSGELTITAAERADERAAAVGLVGGPLRPAQRRRLDLAALTSRIRHRGASLTPGTVAAHALNCRLAAASAQKRAKADIYEQLRAALDTEFMALPAHVASRVDPDGVWQRLVRSGTIARLAARPDATALVTGAGAVLRALPPAGRRIDRRTLVPGDPHALDNGEPLANLVLALAGHTTRRPRRAWAELGVDIDDLTGGLISLGMHPHGWAVPAGAVLTIPPRELLHITWPPAPQPDSWVFVTENPSVVAAVADDLVRQPTNRAGQPRAVRLLCTSGTPSALELDAIGALAGAGWHVAVRADFDRAGLLHVRAMLAACSRAVPWRMDADTYRASVANRDPAAPMEVTAADSPWEPELALAMRAAGLPGYEEDLHPLLLDDLRAETPPPTPAPPTEAPPPADRAEPA